MTRPRVTQEEFDRVLREIERKTNLRFTAGCLDSSAFLTPVDANDMAMAISKCYSWKQLMKISQLPERLQ